MFEEYALRNSCSLACDDTKPLVYDGYDDGYNIFSSPTFEEKISYDYNMPPIFDDYGDENNYSVESAPITIVPVVSINSFMHVAHDRMLYMIVILLVLFMMLLKVIMREGNMV
jgi:hypothetical protein